jgi:hypothetical protein
MNRYYAIIMKSMDIAHVPENATEPYGRYVVVKADEADAAIRELEQERDEWKRRAEAAEDDKAILRRANDESNSLRIHMVEYLRAKLARAVEALKEIATGDHTFLTNERYANFCAKTAHATLAALQDAPQPNAETLAAFREAQTENGTEVVTVDEACLQTCPDCDKLREERDRLLLRADDVLCEIVDITDPNLTSPSERDWLIAQARGVHIDITNALHPDTPGQGETCRYTYDSEWTAWHSECGHTEGLLSDQWQYCPYCRKPIEIRGGEA